MNYLPTLKDFTGPHKLSGNTVQKENLQHYIEEYAERLLVEIVGAKAAEDILSNEREKWDRLFKGVYYNCEVKDCRGKRTVRKQLLALKTILKGMIYFYIVRDDFTMSDVGTVQNKNENSVKRVQDRIAQDRYNRAIIDFKNSVVPYVRCANDEGTKYTVLVTINNAQFFQPLNTLLEIEDEVAVSFINLTPEGPELVEAKTYTVIDKQLVFPLEGEAGEEELTILNIATNPNSFTTNEEPYYGEVGNLTCENDDYVRWNLPEPTEDEPEPTFDVRIMYDDVTDNIPRKGVPVSYELKIRQRGNSPKQFTCDGWDDDTETWVILDQQDLDDWTANENRKFPLNTENEYSMYRIRVTETNGNGTRLTLETLEIESLVTGETPDCGCPQPEPEPVLPIGYLITLNGWEELREINGYNIFTLNIFPEADDTNFFSASAGIYIESGVLGNTVVTADGPTEETFLCKVINSPVWDIDTELLGMQWFFPEVDGDRIRELANSVKITVNVNPEENKGVPTRLRIGGLAGGLVWLTPMLDVEFVDGELTIEFENPSTFQDAYEGYQFILNGATDEFIEFVSVEFRGPARELGLNYQEDAIITFFPYKDIITPEIEPIVP